MGKSKKSWVVGELTFLLLAPFLVLLGVLGYGILFDQWFKDPMIILEYSAIVYGGILILRLFGWAIRVLSN
jgi:hypothetical protein